MKNRKNIEDRNPGDLVRLKLLPPELLNDLPLEDRKAIVKASAAPMRLVEYDEVGRAGLEFTDDKGMIHIIYVNPDVLTDIV
jgi:hypothetical protein